MQVTLEIPDTSVFINLEVGYYDGDRETVIEAQYVYPQEQEYIDMMPETKPN